MIHLKSNNKQQVISKYRSFLMGFSILWIILYHAPFNFDNSTLTTFINRGYLGVDIFLLVSGYGLYFSIEKDNDIRHFYRKRFFRIIPEYWLVIFVCLLLSSEPLSIKKLLIEWSTLGYWVNGLPFYAWYISLICLLYLTFPVIIHYFKKKPIKTFFTIISLSIIFSTLTFAFYDKTRITFFFSHLPVFYTGTLIAWSSKNRRETFHSTKSKVITSFVVIIICAILTYIGNNHAYHYRDLWNPFICWIFSLGVVGLLISLADCLDRIKYLRFINSIFTAIGYCSLELYIIHGDGYYNNVTQYEGFISDKNLLTFLFTIVCFVLSWILYKLNKTFASIIK